MNSPSLNSDSEWRIGHMDQIAPGEGRTFDLDGIRVAVFRTRDGRVFATQADCPHKGGQLADGMMGEDIVVCPQHAYAFSLSTGAPVAHSCGALRTYKTRLEESGEIVVSID